MLWEVLYLYHIAVDMFWFKKIFNPFYEEKKISY